MPEIFFALHIKILNPILWGGKLAAGQNLPKHGPAIFIANHMDAHGPIAITCSLPVRMKYWVIAETMDRDLAPAYMQKDLFERQLHFKPPFSRWFAWMLTGISVPYLEAIGGIPVYHGDGNAHGLQKTLDLSIRCLQEGNYLLIFPENPALPADPLTRMNPFMHSFARLGEMFYKETGQCLDFYPIAVHPKKYVLVGKPDAFNPLNPAGQERQRLKCVMEERIKQMYLLPDPQNWDGNLPEPES